MKKYQKPQIEAVQIKGMGVIMESPQGDILGNPGGGLNTPGGKNAPARPF